MLKTSNNSRENPPTVQRTKECPESTQTRTVIHCKSIYEEGPPLISQCQAGTSSGQGGCTTRPEQDILMQSVPTQSPKFPQAVPWGGLTCQDTHRS